MLNNEFLNKDPYVVTEQAPHIILDSKSDIFVANDVKDIKHTRYIAIRIHFVRNGEECILHRTLWCEGGKKLAENETNNVRNLNLS